MLTHRAIQTNMYNEFGGPMNNDLFDGFSFEEFLDQNAMNNINIDSAEITEPMMGDAA